MGRDEKLTAQVLLDWTSGGEKRSSQGRRKAPVLTGRGDKLECATKTANEAMKMMSDERHVKVEENHVKAQENQEMFWQSVDELEKIKENNKTKSGTYSNTLEKKHRCGKPVFVF